MSRLSSARSHSSCLARAFRPIMNAFATLMFGRTPKPPDAAYFGVTTTPPPRCGLVILAHVPKTGGSTASELLQALPGWTFYGRPNSGHPRFFAAYGALFENTPAFSWHALPSE